MHHGCALFDPIVGTKLWVSVRSLLNDFIKWLDWKNLKGIFTRPNLSMWEMCGTLFKA